MLFFLSLLCADVFAIPQTISQQGRLLDSIGLPLQGTHNLTFRVFESPASTTALWSESLIALFDNGFYTVILGSDTSNPLDSTLLAIEPLYLEMQLDSESPFMPRQKLNAQLYARHADQATSLKGGSVDATQIQVGGSVVIDSNGSWVGPTINLGWEDIQNVPSDFADGVDNDTVLTEGEVEDFVTNGALDLAEGTTIGGKALQESISCQPNQILQYDGSLGWSCAEDSVLTSDDVLGYVTQNPIDLATSSSVDGKEIVSQNGSCNNGQILTYDFSSSSWACAPSVSIDTSSTNKDIFDEEELGNYALLTTARFSDGIGSLELLNLETFEIQSNLTQNIHSDALTVIDPEDPNTIIQINRLGMDSIRLYEWNEWTVPKVEWSVGERANPHDAVLCGDEILLSMYNRNFIGVYDKSGNLTREISLSEYVLPEDEDGNPEASSMLRYGDSVFVALNQLNALDGFSTVGKGRILEYSCSAQEITKTWEVDPNPSLYPFSETTSDDSPKMILQTGSLGDWNGGLSIFDPTNDAEPIEDLFRDADLQRWIYSAAIDPVSERVMLLTYHPDTYETAILCGEASNPQVIETTNVYLPFVKYISSNTILVALSDGVATYNVVTCEIENQIQTVLPPSHVSIYPPR